jgi:hypothetical protein
VDARDGRLAFSGVAGELFCCAHVNQCLFLSVFSSRDAKAIFLGKAVLFSGEPGENGLFTSILF